MFLYFLLINTVGYRCIIKHIEHFIKSKKVYIIIASILFYLFVNTFVPSADQQNLIKYFLGFLCMSEDETKLVTKYNRENIKSVEFFDFYDIIFEFFYKKRFSTR